MSTRDRVNRLALALQSTLDRVNRLAFALQADHGGDWGDAAVVASHHVAALDRAIRTSPTVAAAYRVPGLFGLPEFRAELAVIGLTAEAEALRAKMQRIYETLPGCLQIDPETGDVSPMVVEASGSTWRVKCPRD